MSDISSVSSNMLRITGLATGMDTDSMVKKMMAAENLRLDKMKQNRQYTQWRQDGLRDIIKDFRDLRQSYLLIDSPADTNMIKTAAYSGSTITSDIPNALTARALPGAANGTSTVAIKQVASGAKVSGTKLSGILSSEITDVNVTEFSGGSLVINGKSISIGNLTGTEGNLGEKLDTIVSNINANINLEPTLNGKVEVEKYSPDGGNKYYLRFKQLTDTEVTVTSAKQNDGVTDIAELSSIQNKSLNVAASTRLSDLGIENGKIIKITVPSGSTTITIDNTKTVQDLINSIYNAKVGTSGDTLYSKVKVSFSDLTKSLSIETRDTGSNQTISMDGSDLSTLNKLGLGVAATSGTDAIVKITPPGSASATEIKKSTNSFIIDNVTYNINSGYKVTDTVNGDTVNLTTKPDSQDAVKKIKAFVDKYNTLVQKISDKISEKKNYNYKPLTDDQKSEMKDDQIKSWEDKAKQGILKNDGDLQSILSSVRSAFMDGVKSAGISLSEIGIDTYGSLEAITKPGQLKIDETKLKDALETRGDQVMKIFTATPDSSITDTTEQYNNTGIFKRVENIINNAAVKFDGTLLKKAGYVGTASETTNTITKQLNDQDTAITEMNKKLATKQEKYYQMFAKLETAMNSMNAQQSWLAQQLGTK